MTNAHRPSRLLYPVVRAQNSTSWRSTSTLGRAKTYVLQQYKNELQEVMKFQVLDFIKCIESPLCAFKTKNIRRLRLFFFSAFRQLQKPALLIAQKGTA